MQEQELRSEQADGLGPERHALFGVGKPADVGGDLDAMAVECRRRFVRVRLIRPALACLLPAGPGECARCRRSMDSSGACPSFRRR